MHLPQKLVAKSGGRGVESHLVFFANLITACDKFSGILVNTVSDLKISVIDRFRISGNKCVRTFFCEKENNH
jgi:hypothetical protein